MLAYQMLFGLMALLAYVFRWLNSRYNFWKNLGICYEIPTPFLGNIKDLVLGRAHISDELHRIYNTYPDERFIGFFEFVKPNLMIKDPKLIEHVLVKDFSCFQDRGGVVIDEKLNPLDAHISNLSGNRWRKVRSKLITIFSTGKLKSMLQLVDESVADLDRYLSENCSDGPVDVREVAAKFTTDVIGKCAFGLDFNTLKDPNSGYRTIGKKIMSPSISTTIKNFIRLIDPNILILMKVKLFPKCVEEFFENLLESAMKYRKENNVKRNDLMQLMIDLYEQQLHDDKSEDELGFTENLAAANIFMFYVAGFETTASTLTYIFYELALNPEIQSKLREEINNTVARHNGLTTYDALQQVKYLDMVISETLRKYDPASLTSRESAKDYQIPGTSIIIPRGTKVTIPVHAIHHDPKYYPDPDKFIPERFTEENQLCRPAYTFLPFGNGPRICIGQRFAKMEMKACLAHIVPRYKFSVCPETASKIQLSPNSVLFTASHSIMLSISKV